MTVREVLEAAREAALEIRRIEEQHQLKLLSVGPGGHGYDVHSKSGILDPMRKVVELMDWQEQLINVDRLNEPIEEGYQVVCGIERITDSFTAEVLTRYYLQGESWREIVDGDRHTGVTPLCERAEALRGHSRAEQIELITRSLEQAMGPWERIGIAHLKEMGR